MQVGIFSYFFRLHGSKLIEREAKKVELSISRKPFMTSEPSGGTHSGVTLLDGLVGESFVVLLYGISFAVVVFVSETMVRLGNRILVDLVHNVHGLFRL